MMVYRYSQYLDYEGITFYVEEHKNKINLYIKPSIREIMSIEKMDFKTISEAAS